MPALVPKWRLVSYVRIPPNTTIYARKGAGAWQTINVPEGLYCPDGRGDSDDLVDVIQGLIVGALTPLPDFTLSVAMDTGKLTILNDSGSSVRVSWEDPAASNPNTGYVIRDALRYGSAPDSNSVTVPDAGESVGWRPIEGSLYPIRLFKEDLPGEVGRAVQAESDAGVVQTTSFATLTRHRLRVWCTKAFPRNDDWNDWHAMKDFLRLARKGLPLRYFPDITVVDAWEDVTEPYGWRDWVVDLKDTELDLEPMFNNWLSEFDKLLRLRLYVAL